MQNGGGTEGYIGAVENGAVDLYYDNSKKLETYSGGINVTGYVNLTDSQHLQLGTGDDLQLFHDGTNSVIRNISGTLYLQSVSHIELAHRHANGSEEKAIFCNVNGAVELYDNGNKQVATFDGGLNWQDDKKAEFGNGGDLKIYHDGNHSYIDSHTGSLKIRGAAAGNILLEPRDAEAGLYVKTDGACELYYDGTKKFETNSDGVQIHGNAQFDDSKYIKLGTGDDVQIYHNGSNFHMQHLTSGSLYMDSCGNHNFRNSAGTENRAIFANNAAVQLYYDNSKKFETTSAGAKVTGALEVTSDVDFTGANYHAVWDSSADALELKDNTKLIFGNGDDLHTVSYTHLTLPTPPYV